MMYILRQGIWNLIVGNDYNYGSGKNKDHVASWIQHEVVGTKRLSVQSIYDRLLYNEEIKVRLFKTKWKRKSFMCIKSNWWGPFTPNTLY